MNFRFYMPARVFGGQNAVAAHADVLGSFGKRCLVVTGGHSAQKSGALADVAAALGRVGVQYTVFDGVQQNPSAADCHRAGQAAVACGAQFIIGIGGGSAMDSAKAVAVYAANPDLTAEGLYDGKYARKPLPVVLVGTTAGTGSEVTGVSVLTRASGRKQSVSGPNFYAAVSFADPKYTYAVPFDVTVSTALDAFAHAAEGWFSNAFDDMAKLFGQKALPTLWRALCTLYARQELPDAGLRDEMYYASLYAGMELNLCGAGFPHGMGYTLTEDFGLPHGRACAAFLPAYVQRGIECKPNLASEFFALLGTDFAEFQKIIRSLADLTGISMREAQIKDYCVRWRELKNFKNSPGGYSAEQAGDVLRALFLKEE